MLPFHRITDVGFDIIVELLTLSLFVEAGKKIETVRAINLEGNDILGETLANGILMSPYDCSLRSLGLSGNSLSTLGQINLSEMLVHNRTLYHLAASSCPFQLDWTY